MSGYNLPLNCLTSDIPGFRPIDTIYNNAEQNIENLDDWEYIELAIEILGKEIVDSCVLEIFACENDDPDSYEAFEEQIKANFESIKKYEKQLVIYIKSIERFNEKIINYEMENLQESI